MSDVFICYSRRDADFVHRMVNALYESGREAWVDWEGIPLGANWWDEILQGIQNANYFLFIATKAALVSEFCHRELRHAITFEKRIIPVFRQQIDEQSLNEIEAAWRERDWEQLARENWAHLQGLQRLYFRDSDDFNSGLTKLYEAVETDTPYIAKHTLLLQRAEEWHSRGRHRDWLLHGIPLDEANGWLKNAQNQQPAPTQYHIDYIRESNHYHMHWRIRTRRFVVALPRRVGIEPNRKIFISYRRADSQPYTDRIYDRLLKHFRRGDVFLDVFSIGLGEDFVNIIQRTLAECTVAIVVIGRQWVDIRVNEKPDERRLMQADDPVRLEVEAALKHPEMSIIPLFVDGATMPQFAVLPNGLRKLPLLNGTSIRPGRDFHQDMDSVVRQIRRARRSTSEAALISSR